MRRIFPSLSACLVLTAALPASAQESGGQAHETAERAGAAASSAADPGKASAPRSASTVWNGPRVAAVMAWTLGGMSVIVGGVFGVTAISEWKDATAECAGGDYKKCSARGIALGKTASTSATISTATIAAGGGVVAAGLLLWLVAPSTPARDAGWSLVPVVGNGGAGGAVRGVF